MQRHIKPNNTTSVAIELHAEIKGVGFPILCLHGHPGSAGCMSVFTEHLSQRFQTIAPDLRGYGNSRTRQDFQMQDHIQDLESLLDRYGVEQCLLLGWSLGGILALELALSHPQRFTGMILIASAARPRSNHPPVTGQDLLFTGICSILNRLRPGWQWNVETFGKRSLFRYLLQRHQPIAYQYIAQEAMGAYLKTSGPARRALSAALEAGYNRIPDLPKIQCPSLVLAGEADRHITRASSQETAHHLRNCQWQCYPNTAHLFPWEVPEQVLRDIDQWLMEQ